MSDLGTCCVGAFGVFDCVVPFLFGRVVAGCASVSVGSMSLWCPLFVVAVAVVAGALSCVAPLVPAVAQGFRCAWLGRQWSGFVCVWKP